MLRQYQRVNNKQLSLFKEGLRDYWVTGTPEYTTEIADHAFKVTVSPPRTTKAHSMFYFNSEVWQNNLSEDQREDLLKMLFKTGAEAPPGLVENSPTV